MFVSGNVTISTNSSVQDLGTIEKFFLDNTDDFLRKKIQTGFHLGPMLILSAVILF